MELKFRMPLFYKGKFKEWHYWGFLNDEEFGYRFQGPHSDYPNSPSMQFTGLRDKNGTDIYTGDILRYEHSDGVSVNYRVTYSYLHAAFMCVSNGNFFHLFDIWRKNPVIIGNTDENPELLN